MRMGICCPTGPAVVGEASGGGGGDFSEEIGGLAAADGSCVEGPKLIEAYRREVKRKDDGVGMYGAVFRDEDGGWVMGCPGG